jgi:hypothetical protein
LLASFYHSTYLGNWNDSTAYTAGRDFTSRLHATASYLESRPNNAAKTRSLIANFSEVLTPRWNVTEVLTHKLQVLPDKFLNGGSYEVESSPATVKATKNAAGPETLIIVKQGAGIHAGRSEL